FWARARMAREPQDGRHPRFGPPHGEPRAVPCLPCRAQPACAGRVAPQTPAVSQVLIHASRWHRRLPEDIADAWPASVAQAAAWRPRCLPALFSEGFRRRRSKAPWATVVRVSAPQELRRDRRCVVLPHTKIGRTAGPPTGDAQAMTP